MDITIYNKEKNNLSPISFINDLPNQTKIRDIDTNSIEFRKQLGLLFTKISNLLGIKETILDINKQDIVDLLLMKYKSFSLEEIDYCFKLERFGSLGVKTQHYQLINSDYVSTVLEKYKSWKVFQMKNVVKNIKEQKNISPIEKEKKNNEVLLRFLNEYEYTRKIEDFQFYIYDILDNRGLMPTDVDYKNEIKKEAILILENQYSNRKASSKDEFKSFQRELEQVKLGNGGTVKKKCKVLVVEEFFENLYKDQEKVIEFKNKLKI